MLELLGPDLRGWLFEISRKNPTDHLAGGVARYSVKKSNNLMEADTQGFPHMTAGAMATLEPRRASSRSSATRTVARIQI